MDDKLNVLFLCTGNSCRSQMAEGFARAYHADCFNAYSAGIEKHGMNQLAIKVMAEKDIDISNHSSKTVSEIEVEFDLVITVCGHADESCPVFADQTKVIHIGFDDPPILAKHSVNEEQALVHYRRVRDEISQAVLDLNWHSIN